MKITPLLAAAALAIAPLSAFAPLTVLTASPASALPACYPSAVPGDVNPPCDSGNTPIPQAPAVGLPSTGFADCDALGDQISRANCANRHVGGSG